MLTPCRRYRFEIACTGKRLWKAATKLRFDLTQTRDVRQRHIGFFRMVPLRLVPVTARVDPTSDFRNVLAGVDTVVNGVRIGLQVPAEAFEKILWPVA